MTCPRAALSPGHQVSLGPMTIPALEIQQGRTSCGGDWAWGRLQWRVKYCRSVFNHDHFKVSVTLAVVVVESLICFACCCSFIAVDCSFVGLLEMTWALSRLSLMVHGSFRLITCSQPGQHWKNTWRCLSRWDNSKHSKMGSDSLMT